MDRLVQMTTFARAVEMGSFSAVAREIGIGQSNISRYVAALEAHLGIRLFHRSTRSLTLTEEGERYYTAARRALDAIASAESCARGEDTPHGTLSIACPTLLATEYLVPRLGSFLSDNPALGLDLHISDRCVDLPEEGLDAAIGSVDLNGVDVRARQVGTFRWVCVASCSYVSRCGTPRVPSDLHDHDCILEASSSRGKTWRFSNGDITVDGRLQVNTMAGVSKAVRAGLGIGVVPSWLFEPPMLGNEVQILLKNFALKPTPIYVTYPVGRGTPRRTSAFVDFVAKEFKGMDTLCE